MIDTAKLAKFSFPNEAMCDMNPESTKKQFDRCFSIQYFQETHSMIGPWKYDLFGGPSCPCGTFVISSSMFISKTRQYTLMPSHISPTDDA